MMKVLRGGQGVSGGSAAAVWRRRRAGRGQRKEGRGAAPDGHDGEARDEGVKFHVPGLALAELDEGQLDAPPGLGLVRHGGVGAAFVLFWLLVSCLRGAAACGPARGGAARRGGGGGVVGGSATSGSSFAWRLLLFGANLRNVELREWGRCGGMDALGLARRRVGAPTEETRAARGTPGALARAAARPQKQTRRTGGRRPIRQAILPLPGRCWEGSGSVAQCRW